MDRISGIVGLRKADETGAGELKRMIRCITREPHQISETFDRPTLGIHVAWVRNSQTPYQAWNAERDILIVLAGEEFGVARSTDRNSPHKAELYIEAYQVRGMSFVEDLNGWFSGFLIDLRKETVLLFNDRYGIGRVYYHESAGGFSFASEAKALLAARAELRQIDQQGIAEVVAVGCVLQNRSLFRGVRLLPAGSVWTLHRNGRVEKRRYFDPEVWENQESLEPTTYTARLREVMSRITPGYINGNQSVGMSLTGGLDSRMILAWAQAPAQTLPCYTFGGPYRDCADVRIARRLAGIFNQPHSTIRIESDFFRDFPELAAKTVLYSDGAMDVSGAVELYVNRKANAIAPIRLTGNYGSEVLRSHVAFGPRRLDTSLFTPEFCGLLAEATETYRRETHGHRLSFIAFKQLPWFHYARFAVEKSQVTPRSPFLDNELVSLAFQAPPLLEKSAQPLLQVITEGNPALRRVPTDRSLSQDPFPLIGQLSQFWREFTAKAEYAYDYGMPAWLTTADRLLGCFRLERLFLGHHKFYHFRIWYRDQLGSYLRESLDGRAELPWYRHRAAMTLLSEHLDGRRNHTTAIHTLLTILMIEQVLLSPR